MSSGTSKIVESIMSEAQEKADLIIQDANAEVSAIQAKAEKSAVKKNCVFLVLTSAPATCEVNKMGAMRNTLMR